MAEQPKNRPSGQRPRTLEVEDYRSEKSTNPYDRVDIAGRPDTPGTGTTRRDLRKLSEWIKLKREMEARKQRGEDEPD
ncbi:MAG: hypothetical protein KF790_03220 [Steroidobacteraceae bacterium]|nr:hypothetical protein [Steroidobacteraceae bacterium]MCW5574271.1 hypothetical protein [Steroidobacteraceae bacterium]